MRQECKKKEEYGGMKAYEASQESDSLSSNRILIKSQQIIFFLKAKRILL